MRFSTLVILIVLSALFSCGGDQSVDTPAEAQESTAGPKIVVSASVDSPTVDIGARVTYRVEVRFRPGIEVDWPPILEQLDHQIVYDAGIWTEEDPVGNYRVRSFEVVLDPGIDDVLTIEPTVIRWREREDQKWLEATTDAITVEVVSVAEGAPELQEPLDAFELPRPPARSSAKDHRNLLLAVGGALLALGIFAFLLLRQRKKKIIPPPSPEELARQELAHLESLDLLQSGQVKEFYYRLTAIVRRYIELRFSIMAPEQTTEEFLRSMRDDVRLLDSDKAMLKDFMATADLVRYALHTPPLDDVRRALDMARQFTSRVPEKNEEVAHAL